MSSKIKCFICAILIMACLIGSNLCFCDFNVLQLGGFFSRNGYCYVSVTVLTILALFIIATILRNCCNPILGPYLQEMKDQRWAREVEMKNRRLEKERKIREANMSDEEKAERAERDAHRSSIPYGSGLPVCTSQEEFSQAQWDESLRQEESRRFDKMIQQQQQREREAQRQRDLTYWHNVSMEFPLYPR